MAKRLFDIFAALALSGPAIALIAIAALTIKLGSRGPVFFVQRRVGRNQQIFSLVKLRTMAVDTGDHASHDVGSARITPVGHVLRRLKVDELPQLICVLQGTMSIVGPRPCLPSQVELIKARQARGVFNVRPGITGLAQVRDIDMARPELLARIDEKYVKSRSFAFDLKLIGATALGGGRGDAATR